jgi:hypothetical protein
MNTRNIRFARICRSDIVHALSNIKHCMIFKLNSQRRLSKIAHAYRSGLVNTLISRSGIHYTNITIEFILNRS